MLQRLKRLAGRSDEPSAEYVCRACKAGFEVQRQVCPECEGYSIERRDW